MSSRFDILHIVGVSCISPLRLLSNCAEFLFRKRAFICNFTFLLKKNDRYDIVYIQWSPIVWIIRVNSCAYCCFLVELYKKCNIKIPVFSHHRQCNFQESFICYGDCYECYWNVLAHTLLYQVGALIVYTFDVFSKYRIIEMTVTESWGTESVGTQEQTS